MSIIMKYNRRKEAGKPKMWKITQDATIKVPSGIRSMDVFLVGGGGAGASGSNLLVYYRRNSTSNPYAINFTSSVGGAGAWVKTKRLIEVEPNQTLSIKVGAGGKAIKVGKNNENRPFALNDRSVGSGAYGYVNVIGSLGKGQTSYFGPRYGWSNFNLGCILGNGENSYIKSNGNTIAEAKGGGGFLYCDDDALSINGDSYYGRFYQIAGSNNGGNYGESPSLSTYYNKDGESGGGNYNNKIRTIKYKGSIYYGQSVDDLDPSLLPFLFMINGVQNDTITRPNSNNFYGLRLLAGSSANNTYDDLLLDGKPIKFARINSASYMRSDIFSLNYFTWSSQKNPLYNLKTIAQFATDAPINTRLFEEEDNILLAGGGGRGRIKLKDGSVQYEAGNGGDGGGGDGAKDSNAGNGEVNTGGGGGGAQWIYQDIYTGSRYLQRTMQYPAGDGGSGVVYIRFFPNERRDTQVDWDYNPVII